MILGVDREKVIENIKEAAENGDFYRKVEIHDPILSREESKAITDRYLKRLKSVSYRCKAFFARRIAHIGTALLNRDTEIIGSIPPSVLKEGVLITSNHFSPLENTVIRHFALNAGKRRLNIVSQVTNFAMPGFIGFLMNYADTVPLSEDLRYLSRECMEVLEGLMAKREAVLIYPEQEMWFRYRKPRPLKRGAYHFAARLGKPIVSCFVELVDRKEAEKDPHFKKIRYRLHLLGVLYPDPALGVKENSEALCRADYALKKEAYEKAYGKPLTYEFEREDIAGWCG